MMELDLSQGYPQLKSACSLTNPQLRSGLFNFHGLQSPFQAKETGGGSSLASDGQSSRKIFGFLIPESIQQCDSLSPEQPQRDLVTNKRLMNDIDLNLDLNFSDYSAGGETAVVPLQVSAGAETSWINLEEGGAEAVIQEVAHSILLLSSLYDKESPLDGVDFPPAAYDHLNLFAVVASNPENAQENPNDERDELDSFEKAAMELKEIKPEEYQSWRSKELLEMKEDGKNKKSNLANLLFAKPRRGQARKRRQKRDFQRDILPVMATMSRNELNEDIDLLVALMATIGKVWQPRRSGVRNVASTRARRARSGALTIEEPQVSVPPPPSPSPTPPPPLPPPPPPPPAPAAAVEAPLQPEGALAANNNDVGEIAWGRTTRRCKRQRLPPVSSAAAQLT